MFKWIDNFFNDPSHMSLWWSVIGFFGLAAAIVEMFRGGDSLPWTAFGLSAMAMSGIEDRRRVLINVAKAADEELGSLHEEIRFLKSRMSDQDRMIMEVKRNVT